MAVIVEAGDFANLWKLLQEGDKGLLKPLNEQCLGGRSMAQGGWSRKAAPLVCGIGVQGQGMHPGIQFFTENAIDHLMTDHAAQAFKLITHQGHLKVSLGIFRNPVATAFIAHLEVTWRKFFLQFLGNCFFNGHGFQTLKILIEGRAQHCYKGCNEKVPRPLSHFSACWS